MSGVDIAMAVIAAVALAVFLVNCWMLERIRRDLQEIHRDLQEINERLERYEAMLLQMQSAMMQQIESGQNPQLPEVCRELQAGEEMRNEPSQDSS